MNIISELFSWVLNFCNKIVGNQYLLALLLFAIIVEIVLLPFGIKQQKNFIKQAKLRPKEMAIRKKYAGRDDKPTQQKMQQEIQELQQREGFNPMSGCLPMLIQLPVLLALYDIVIKPLTYIGHFSESAIRQMAVIAGVDPTAAMTNNINLVGKIQELGFESVQNVEGMTQEVFNNLPDMEVFGGLFDLSVTPWFTGEGVKLLWVPFLTFLAYFFSMKMQRKLSYQPANVEQAGCSNKIMDWMMPLFSVFIAFSVPAAIGVYWIFKSLLGVGKQAILHVAMPLPKMTEADVKAAEKEMNMREDKKEKPVAKSGKAVRSLHHIDDEDFEDTAPAAKARREALEAAQQKETAEKVAASEKSMLNMGAIKEEEKPPRKEKPAKKQKEAEQEIPAESAPSVDEQADAPQKDTETETNGEEK